MTEEPVPEEGGVDPETLYQLHRRMSAEFLAVLADAARIYAATEDDVGFSLPADIWYFVEWCQIVGGESPELDAEET
jgi:hypothetical protein